MSKINIKLIDKLKEKRCSSIEINLFLYLSSVQSEFGSVRGIYYKDICLALNITPQSYYASLDKLHEKGLIIRDMTNTWGINNLTIADNIYLNDKDYRSKAYINTNKFGGILFSKEFKESSVNFKYLVLQLLKCQREEKNFKISVTKLKQYANVSSNVINDYLKLLSKFFEIKQRGEVYYIKVKQEYSIPGRSSERDLQIAHELRSFCRLYKVTYVLKDLKDILQLFKQYPKKIMQLRDAIAQAAITYRNQGKGLQPAAIHSILQLH